MAHVTSINITSGSGITRVPAQSAFDRITGNNINAPHITKITIDNGLPKMPPVSDHFEWNTTYLTNKAFIDLNIGLQKRGIQPLLDNVPPKEEHIRVTALGCIGEMLVEYYTFKKTGLRLILAPPFDPENDFVHPTFGKIEVKTQTPFYTQGAFSVRKDQYNKLEKVDLVYFVETPRPRNQGHLWDHTTRANATVLGNVNAADYEATIYTYSNNLNANITSITHKKTIWGNDRTKPPRDMILFPMNNLTPTFTIDDPSHLIMLDKYSTKPIGLK